MIDSKIQSLKMKAQLKMKAKLKIVQSKIENIIEIKCNFKIYNKGVKQKSHLTHSCIVKWP